MKLKNYVNLTLAVLMVFTLFSGCKQEQPQSSSNATQTSEGENTEQRVINGVYASCGNYVYTIRTTANASIQFYLMTEKPLPADAAITVDTESEYRFWIKNKTPEHLRSNYPIALAMWAEYGVDFAEYYALQEEKRQAQIKYSVGELTKAEYEEVMVAREEKMKKLNLPEEKEVREKYIDVTPPFFFYEVDLRVKHTGTEVIKECQLVAGDMSRTIPIGEVTQIYETNITMAPRSTGTGVTVYPSYTLSESFPQLDVNALLHTFEKVPGNGGYPYSPYTDACRFAFVAQNDITLKDVYSLDGVVEYVYAEIIIVGQNGQTVVKWTPGTELLIRKNEFAYLNLHVDHPDLHGTECCIGDELRVVYSDSNGGGYMRQDYSYLRKRPLMEMYLWAFKGIDTKAFCERYFENEKFMMENPVPALGG